MTASVSPGVATTGTWTPRPSARRTTPSRSGSPPRLEALVRTSHYAQLSAILVEARTAIAATVDGVAARVLHEVNLPAGTDVNSPAPASRTASGSGGDSGGFWRAGRGCGRPGGSTGPQRVGGFRGEQHGVPPQFWLKALRTAKSA